MRPRHRLESKGREVGSYFGGSKAEEESSTYYWKTPWVGS